MKLYVIQRSGFGSMFRIEAKSYLEAIEIFKGYGQYEVHKSEVHFIFDVDGKTFVDMIREDFYLITEF